MDFNTSSLGSSAKVLEAICFPGADAAIGNTAAGTAPATQYLMQLYAAAGVQTDSSLLMPVGEPVNTRSGTFSSGYSQIAGTTTLGWPVDSSIVIPFLSPGGPVTIQLRAWWAGPSGNTYPTYEAALARLLMGGQCDMRLGESYPLLYLPATGNPLAQPPEMPVSLNGLKGFQLMWALSPPIPLIYSHPTNQMAAQGSDVNFFVGAFTHGGFCFQEYEMAYQWRKNGTLIAGATYPDYTLRSVTPDDEGEYDAIVSRSYCGSTTSRAARLTLYFPPTLASGLATNPPNAPLGVYAALTLSGQANHAYRIQNCTNLTGVSSWMTITNLTLTVPVQIWVDTSLDVHGPGNVERFYRVIAP